MRSPALSAFILAALLPASAATAEPAARVFLNGSPAPVYFNDGDSFRVLGGKLAGTKARLAGFNTLESYGPVHQWGDWTAKELYFIAKMATLNATRGVWNCESDMEKDTYGRILWWCEDLAVDQVRKGLAHAMSVTNEPAHPKVLEAQREAIANRRGMWAHGVPDFVLTSLHSITEGGGKDGRTYNRMVSSKDGHSQKWQHTDKYGECDKVCHYTKRIPDRRVADTREALKGKGVLADYLTGMADGDIDALIRNYVTFGSVGYMETKEMAYALDEVLGDLLRSDLEVAEATGENGCMIYVDFRRRYGGSKAKCLK